MAVKPTSKPPAKGKNGFVKRDSKTGQFVSVSKPGRHSADKIPRSEVGFIGMRAKSMNQAQAIKALQLREKREMTMVGSVLGAVAVAVFTPAMPLILAGAVLGGALGSKSKTASTVDNKE